MKRIGLRKPNLDTARAALILAIERAVPKVTLKELSISSGRNHAYLHQYLFQGSPRKLPEEVRQHLAQTLNIDEHVLIPNDGAKIRSKREAQVYVPARVAGPAYGARDLPILGRSNGTEDRFSLAGSSSGVTERPIYLENVSDAFAVYVTIDTMKPRFKRGEMVYVDPSRPAEAGDDVLVEFSDGQCTIKEFISRRKGRIHLRQYNPERELSVPATSVRRISLIVGTRRV